MAGPGIKDSLRQRGVRLTRQRQILLELIDESGEHLDAERLYARLGWICVGPVPGYALMPDGAPCDTTFFYRRLDA